MRRIAILYPWGALDTHPSLSNAATLLARAGYSVDLFVRSDRRFPAPVFAEPGIEVVAIGEYDPGGGIVRRVVQRARRFAEPGRLLATALLRHLRSPYRLVVGVDPEGIVQAHPVARLLRRPLAYFSFELLLDHDELSPADRRLKARERRASRDLAFALVQDPARATLLRDANGIPPERCVLVPNAPLGAPPEARSRRWHEAFGLPPEQKVLLYAGSFGAWAGVDAIACSTRSWPDGWSLVLHFRSRPPEAELERLRAAGGEWLHLSTEPVPHDELDDLYAAADAGVALYFTDATSPYRQENLKTMGLASGKLAYYLRAGLPVIVNDTTSLADFVRDEGCGAVVSNADEIGAALARFDEDYAAYSGAARRAFAGHLDFESAFAEIVRRVDALASRESARV